MNQAKNPLRKLGWLLTSVEAIIFVMTMIIIAMIFHTQTLFYRYLPSDMPTFSRAVSSIVLAIGFEFTVLLTTTNSKYLKGKWGTFVFALTTFIISAFFFEAFDFNQPRIIILFRFFASLIIALVNYVYSDLFSARWVDYINQEKISEELTFLKKNNLELTNKYAESQAELKNAQLDLKSSLKKLSELEKEKTNRIASLTCPYCQSVFASESKLRGHKGRCMMKNKTQLNDNGKVQNRSN